MKRATIISLALILGLCLVAGAFAADKDAIKKQVDEIVVSMHFYGSIWQEILILQI